jgi:hypothetical protein
VNSSDDDTDIGNGGGGGDGGSSTIGTQAIGENPTVMISVASATSLGLSGDGSAAPVVKKESWVRHHHYLAMRCFCLVVVVQVKVWWVWGRASHSTHAAPVRN